MAIVEHASLEFAPARVERTELADGGFVLSSPMPLASYPDHVCACLHHWADKVPDRTFLAERGADGAWRRVSYGEALQSVRAIAAALLARGISADTPVMLLSDNSIENGLLQLGSIYAGIPATPISPAYSLMSEDHEKLKYIYDLVGPKLIFAADGARFEKALSSLDLTGVELVIAANEARPATPFSDLLEAVPGAAVDAAYRSAGPDTPAKILFTSGSTGQPKGVINTHRMMVSNQQMMLQVWPFLKRRPPVILDWLPWHHTFGGNHNFNMMLYNGGTLFIDQGKPVPGLIDRSIANLSDVAPTLYFNVPRGFDMVLPYLEEDERLRDYFFSELDLIFYAAAALPQNLWERLERLSIETRGSKIPMTSSWGATETAPAVTNAHFPIERAGVIGLPLPGVDLKFTPNGDKLEMRVRGPLVMPGYYLRDDLTKAAFDDDGFYRIGDAGRLADPDNPAAGVVFDGRVAEDFKLMSGSWVSVGNIRIAAVAAGAPVIQDCVVTGHDRDEVGILVFPNVAGCAKLAGREPSAPLDELIAAEAVRDKLRRGIGHHNQNHAGSSLRIARALIMTAPPSIDKDEITDKGYINQRAAIANRADLVDLLYSDDPRVIRL